MSSKPPNIRIPGRRPRGIPTGYLLGRVDPKTGPIQLVARRALERLGVASARSLSNVSRKAGWGLNVQGLILAGENLGSGSWAHDTRFMNAV